MNIWHYDLSEMPVDMPVFVFLAEDHVGSRIHAATKMKIANGYLMVVASHLASDLPDILAWRHMVEDPREEVTG